MVNYLQDEKYCEKFTIKNRTVKPETAIFISLTVWPQFAMTGKFGAIWRKRKGLRLGLQFRVRVRIPVLTFLVLSDQILTANGL